LEKLVEKDDDEGCGDELNDEEKADACTEVGRLSVEACEDVDCCLAKGDDECEDWRCFSGDRFEERGRSYERFWAPLKRARSSLRAKSTSTRFAPARSCMIIPEVTTGPIPSSMRVPRLEAMMTRSQYIGSEESEDMMP
jgi:hypothetical protein